MSVGHHTLERSTRPILVRLHQIDYCLCGSDGDIDQAQSKKIGRRCIGAWVGIVYNQWRDDEDKAEKTYQFFKNGVFRDDESYKRFPINAVFGPDWRSNIKALNKFVTDPDNYRDLAWDPYKIMGAFRDSMELLLSQLPDGDQRTKFKKLDEGDFNRWILNQVMAPNPFIRYLTSMM
jgi:hypothetical protein